MINVDQQTDAQWAARLTAPLPAQWQRRIFNRWERAHGRGGDWTAQSAARFQANTEIRRTVEGLGSVRIGLDATDAHICQEAERIALVCIGRAELFHKMSTLRAAMERVASDYGIEAPDAGKVKDAGAVARLSDPLWWRRQLRKQHAKQVEGAAIQLGYVNRARECYVSDQSLQRRIDQNRRNAATLENTTATNEDGQEFTLAELAAKGPANKAIRRSELMTRINGFERIALDMGHAGLFMTITCPSFMHKWRTVKAGGVRENARYEGTTPREAQTYMGKVWARIRAALHRAKIGIYGFRVAEPNHDGTPHWHLLIFHAAQHLGRIKDVVLKHALRAAPDEPGALAHRVDFKPMDAEKGTAAGYIAKYVAKNIDGYRLESDLYGNPALESSARIEAWATTWGIRQFQQVGGPPVGPWRELRRIETLPIGAPDHLQAAHRAVNKLQAIEGKENASVSWQHYTRAQGGVFCGRRYLIRVATKEIDGLGRYGEPIGERPIGVSTMQREFWTPPHMAHMGGRSERLVHWVVESKRYRWTIGKKRGGGEVGFSGHAVDPWTRVNNCTEGRKNDGKSGAGDHAGGNRRANFGLGERASAHPDGGGGLRGTDDDRDRGHKRRTADQT